jgi:SanA protein
MNILLNKKIFFRLYIPIFLLLIITIVFCNSKVEQFSNHKLYDDVHEIPYNKVGLVLGTCKTLNDKVTINPYWQYRLDATYQLWKNKKIDRILISGDNGWHGYNEPEDFRKAFILLGIPDSVMYCDFAGFRTHDSVIRCKKVFKQKKVTIISQKFHNKRALVIAQKYNLDAIAFNAKDVRSLNIWYDFLREKLARVKLFLDLYILQTEAHFLGEPITIK